MTSSLEPSPGSPFANFKDSMRKILSVSKTELDEIRKKEGAKKRRREAAKRRRAAA